MADESSKHDQQIDAGFALVEQMRDRLGVTIAELMPIAMRVDSFADQIVRELTPTVGYEKACRIVAMATFHNAETHLVAIQLREENP